MFPNACRCVAKCYAYLETCVLHRKAFLCSLNLDLKSWPVCPKYAFPLSVGLWKFSGCVGFVLRCVVGYYLCGRLCLFSCIWRVSGWMDFLCLCMWTWHIFVWFFKVVLVGGVGFRWSIGKLLLCSTKLNKSFQYCTLIIRNTSNQIWLNQSIPISRWKFRICTVTNAYTLNGSTLYTLAETCRRQHNK